jgi:hypothetical protein
MKEQDVFSENLETILIFQALAGLPITEGRTIFSQGR